jgi:ABC-type polysaccharide/polyol phosphate export permease
MGTAITTAAFGLLWSQLWGQPIKEFLPYVGVAHILWALITGPMNDALSAFQANSFYYSNQKAPISTIFYGIFYRHVIILLHNLIVVFGLWAIFGIFPGFKLLLVLPAMLLLALVSVAMGILIGLVCARYRDMQQVVGNAIQVLYFMTPVMWMPEFLPERGRWVVDYNPFAQLLAILRDPLLAREITLNSWIVSGSFTMLLLAFCPLAIAKFKSRVVFWL